MPTWTPKGLQLAESSPTGSELPSLDPDQHFPAGLRWTVDLESRPIILGRDRPELRHVLDIRAGRFWTGARHGLAIGRTERTLHDAALAFAFSADLRAAHLERAALARAGSEYDAVVTDYIEEMSAA